MKNKRLWILHSGIVLFSAAFLLLNFRVAVSNTSVIPRIIVSKLEGYPDRLSSNDKISLVLVGEGPLVRPLQKTLMEKWDRARMGQIELEQEPRSTYPNPVLVIQVGSPGLFWTPFFAMSQFSIHAGYATNGDPSFMENLDKTQLTIRSPDPSVVNLYNELRRV